MISWTAPSTVNPTAPSGQAAVVTLEPTDAELITSSLARPIEFAAIFERHFEPISSYLRRRVPMGIAEELAAQVFVVAFERRADFETDRGSARPWLFGIATNLIRRHHREELRRIRAYRRLTPDEEADISVEATARADAQAREAAIHAGLSALEQRDRDVLLLFALAELSYEEIGEAMAIPVGTVRSRLSRARRQISAQIAQHERGGPEQPEGVGDGQARY